MPFCTACGSRTRTTPGSAPSAARRLAAPEPATPQQPATPEPPADASHRVTATITFGGVGRASRDLRPPAQPRRRRRRRRAARRTRAPGGAARARRRQPFPPRPRPGARPDATPRARSSSTTSPSPAGTRSSSAPAPTFAVRDVGSLNGTYVNRDRIDEVSLKDGDEVQIGKYRLVFYSGHANG